MSKVPYTKLALSYTAQLQQLKDRGLIVDNEAKVLHLLEVISYFDTAFNIYKFDRELRLLVLRQLEKIEVAVRAKMIYTLSHSKGAFWYLDSANFSKPIKHAETLTKIGNEYSRSDEEFIQAFKAKYSDPMPPSWIMLEVSSFGTLSALYSYLIPCIEKREIANYFGLSDKVLSSWLHSIVYLRNICAHHARLWNREMQIQPIIPRSPLHPFINQTTYTDSTTGSILPLNNKSYFILSMVIYFLNTINPTHKFQDEFKQLLVIYPNVDTAAMGFPDNWQLEALWI